MVLLVCGVKSSLLRLLRNRLNRLSGQAAPFGDAGAKLSRRPVPAHRGTRHQAGREEALCWPPGDWFDFIAKLGAGAAGQAFARRGLTDGP